MAVRALVRKCPVRRLGKALYLSVLAIALVLVLVSLKVRSDIRTGFKGALEKVVQGGRGQHGGPQGNQAGAEPAVPLGEKAGSSVSGKAAQQGKGPPEVYTPAPTFPATLTSNTSAFRISTGVSGKLGNQMFQYASLLGIAAMNQMLPFYTSSLLQTSFMITHHQDWSFKGFRVVDERDFATYDPTFEHLRQENTLIMQYFQSWKYFQHIKDIVRKEFTFKEYIQTTAQQLINKHSARIGNRTRVAVHIRRGDMMLTHLVKKGYHIAPASYVRQAMDYMRQKHPHVIFLVATDDVNWCKSNMDAPDVVYLDWASAQAHLAVLASSDHVIMTVGTFGWWGGYLSGGEVVYYWDPKVLLHDPPLPVEIKHPEDFFPSEWRPLSGV